MSTPMDPARAKHVLEVWGEMACFTRPEFKVERFSYPVITPSAARGVFDAIYFKRTEFRWQVFRVEILAPPAYIALRRNEVKEKVSVPAVQKWMAGRGEPEPIWADGDKETLGTDMKGRTQRQTMALTAAPGVPSDKGVHYRLHAEIRPWPGFAGTVASLDEQFRRRAGRGQCFHQPCFGCKEFPAYFHLVEESDPRPPPVLSYTQDLGLMLYDVFDLSRPGTPDDAPSISLFRAKVDAGVMNIPDYSDEAILKPAGTAEKGGTTYA